MNTKTKNSKTLQIVNIVSFVVVVVMNVLSNALPLNGRTPGEISDSLPSFFTPAAYTFSIWSVIYLFLLGFTIYQALPSQRERPFLGQIGWLFAGTTVLNVFWLLAWHYGFYAVSVLFMVGLLVTLITIYLRLNIGHRSASLTIADKLLYQTTFSLYLGWITVATIANIASVLGYLGWNGFGIDGQIWSAIMMMVAVVVAGLLLFNRRNLAYAGVLVWALFGIRAAYPTVPVIANTALVAAGLIVILALIGYWRTQKIEPASPEPQVQTA
ncbi:MAG: tryptophan-rich sensory protein [Anaerolineae bacterium]|nr:tryptophan-rich sensory protein [Anaerolineae bacterium]